MPSFAKNALLTSASPFILTLASLPVSFGLLTLSEGPARADHFVECTSKDSNWTDKNCWHDRHRPDHSGGSDVVIGQNPVLDRSGQNTKNYEISITNDAVDPYYGVTIMPVNTITIGENFKAISNYDVVPASGSLRVAGDKAGLKVKSHIFLGKKGGNGTLTIEDGARVWTDRLLTGGYYHDSAETDARGSGTATVNISGSGSALHAKKIVLGVASSTGQTFKMSDGAYASATTFIVDTRGAPYPSGYAYKPVVSIENSTLNVGTLNITPDPSANIYDVFKVNSGGILEAENIHLTTNTNPYFNNTTLWFYGGTLHMMDRDNGKSPSTTVNGQLVFGYDSTLSFDATALDQHADLKITKDLVNPTYTAGHDYQTYLVTTISVNANKAGFIPVLDTEFTIIEASSTGAFDTDEIKVKSGYNFLDTSARFDGKKGYLTLTKSANAVTAKAVTGNEKAVAGTIEKLGTGNAIHDAFISTPSSQSASSAYNGLTGETHASATSSAFHAAFASSGVVSNRMLGTQQSLGSGSSTAFHGKGDGHTPFLSAPEIWFRGYGNVLSVEGSGSAADTDTSTGGMMAGIDALAGDAARLGVAFGYSRSFSNTSDRQSKSRMDGYHGFVYGNAQFGLFGLQAGLGATYNQIDVSRATGIAGLPGNLTADYTGWTGQAWLEGAYTAPIGLASTVEPFAGLSLVSNHSESFTEKGNAAALNVGASHQTNLFSTLGVRLGHEIDLSDTASFRVSGSLGWRHAFGDTAPDSVMSYASGSSSFSISGLPLERDTVVFDAGIDMAVSNSTLLDLRYSGQLGAHAQDHGLKGTLRLSF
ncbi:autotransporter outer membrane beta-barrel domain-containing protein [Roseibium algae]|uniref:Autotransporter outer membrane beta-barrel domain-containing protein n=1 Tax=Roseibium algae TaxID=3123038 RepID=A0ABU8TGD3_9HYPH